MLSINTNLSSLIAQQSLSSSTAKLNQAIERMSTGFKINHAKDNAANYSISQNMQIQISSYDVAADNVAMGMDLVTTASDIISTMQNHASRLQALSTQARNGTYGAQSMSAINSEAAAIMAEINRLYSTAEYNNVSLFNREAYEIANHLPKAGRSGFIDESALTTSVKAKDEYNGFIEDPKTYTDAEVAAMTRVKDVSTFSSGQKYAIYTKEELEKLADYVNDGNDTSGVEFVLGADIDLSSISNWTPIGTYEDFDENKTFKGVFNGNGKLISNLTINSPDKNSQGLFGDVYYGAVIKNVAIVKVNIIGNGRVGALVGYSDYFTSIFNCYSTGEVCAKGDFIGGLVGSTCSDIENCYSEADVSGGSQVGGLIGSADTVKNCYATGKVQSKENYCGGVAGYVYSIYNSYATGDVVSTANYIGGVVGSLDGTVENCYSKGNVKGKDCVGGITGYAMNGSIFCCYSLGNIIGENNIGGIAGRTYDVSHCYSKGNVSGKENVGGIIGVNASGDGFGGLVKCYTTGIIKGEKNVGGFIGLLYSKPNNVKDSACYSMVVGNENTGSLFGSAIITEVSVVNYGSGETRYENSNFSIINCQAIPSNLFTIGNALKKIEYEIDYEDPDTGDWISNYDTVYEEDTTFNLSTLSASVGTVACTPVITTLQVGINSDESCQINFDTNFKFDLSSIEADISSDSALATIMEFTNLLSEKSTQLGAVQNRLDSAIESIEVNLNNLTSSLSTIRDADIAEVSSEYIQQQILQQASATLLATANQSPSIALQLI